MKYILTFLFCFFVSYAFAQPIVQRATAGNTVQDARLYTQYNFRVPVFNDTATANTQKGIDSSGTIIYTYDIQGFWVRQTSPKKWNKVTPSGAGTGTVQSVGLSMPSAFTVSNSPITTSGTIGVTANGSTSQYIRGNGTLQTFPTFISPTTLHDSLVNYITNVYRSHDTVYLVRNGVSYFAYLDSTGGGAANAWLITGNSGLNASTNYIGTNDNVDFVIKRNAGEEIRLSENYVSMTNSEEYRIGNDASKIKIGGGHTVNSEGGQAYGQYDTLNIDAFHSTTIGSYSTANAYNSYAIGHYLHSGYFGGVVVGESNVYANGSTTERNSSDKIFQIGNGNSDLNIRSNAMTVLRNGNVGIGTTTPDSTFHVVGGLKFPSLYSSNNASDSMLVVKSDGGIGYRKVPTSNGVTSVGLTMPSAFTVSNSPITSSGNISVTGAGLVTQYVRGDGTLANFPSVGGGGGTIYYLNGNTFERQLNGDSAFQMATFVGGGSGRTFSKTGTGLLATFITDSLKPYQTVIPSGVWLFNVFFQESGAGASHVQMQVKMKKWNGTTLTTIDSSQVEELSNGNEKDLYTFSISLNSNYSLNVTDRIVLQFYISNNASNKTTYLFTEDNNIASVVTTFPNGISTLNGLTAATQYFAIDSTGNNFSINSSVNTHTFSIPTASSTKRGLLSSSDWTTFNNKGTVSSVATGYGLSGGTITTNGTLLVDSSTLANTFLRRADSSTYYTKFRSDTSRSNIYTQIATKGSGTVTSVTANSPLSSTGGTTPVISADTTTANTGLTTKYQNGLKLNITDTANMRVRLVAGTNITSISGTYPNLTINAATQGGAVDSTFFWQQGGNAITSSGNKTLGTTNSTSLRLISNGSTRMTIDSLGSVGIGTTASASALLELSSTTKGMLMPSMTQTQRNAVSSPAEALIIFNTTRNTFDFYRTVGATSGWYSMGAGCKYGATLGRAALGAYTGTGDAYNVAIGDNALSTGTSNTQCTSVGGSALQLTTGNNNTALGYASGLSISSGTNNAVMGYRAGQYMTTESNRLILNSIDRSNKGGDTTSSLVYGYQNTTLTNAQYLKINGAVSINDGGAAYAKPVNSAILDLSTNTTKGFLPPVLTATQASAITSPAEGLLVYVSNTNATFTAKGWWGYDGTNWQKLNN